MRVIMVSASQEVDALSATRAGVKVRERITLEAPPSETVVQLLGPEGIRALDAIIEAVDAEALRERWPITAAQVHTEADPEDPDARTVELVFIVDADAEEAEATLSKAYDVLQRSVSGMNETTRERLMNTLFFDVATG